MEKPTIAGKAPVVTTLEAGEYYWCACGRSQNQPFCDGSHKGTSFSPVTFTIDTKKKVALCLCKQTGNPPFCDGTHKKLGSDPITARP
jgi:CDGSH-type Zn-finger protein